MTTVGDIHTIVEEFLTDKLSSGDVEWTLHLFERSNFIALEDGRKDRVQLEKEKPTSTADSTS